VGPLQLGFSQGLVLPQDNRMFINKTATKFLIKYFKVNLDIAYGVATEKLYEWPTANIENGMPGDNSELHFLEIKIMKIVTEIR
jgi:hypothetical protein